MSHQGGGDLITEGRVFPWGPPDRQPSWRGHTWFSQTGSGSRHASPNKIHSPGTEPGSLKASSSHRGSRPGRKSGVTPGVWSDLPGDNQGHSTQTSQCWGGGALRSLTTTLLLGDGQWLGPPPRAFLGEAAQMRQLGPGRFRASGFYFPHLDLWFPRPREAKRLAQEHTATDWAFST